MAMASYVDLYNHHLIKAHALVWHLRLVTALKPGFACDLFVFSRENWKRKPPFAPGSGGLSVHLALVLNNICRVVSFLVLFLFLSKRGSSPPPPHTKQQTHLYVYGEARV